MPTTKKIVLQQKKLRGFLDRFEEVEKDKILIFLKTRARRKEEFLFDILAQFTPDLDGGEELPNILLKTLYSKILRKQSSKIDKQVRQLFEIIDIYTQQSKDCIALEDLKGAFVLLRELIYFSSKTLYKIEPSTKILQTHLTLFELLDLLLEQIKAPALKKEINIFLRELVSNFYYEPYHLELNAFVMLLKLENYGRETFSVLEKKYREVENKNTQNIIACLLLDVYLKDQKKYEKKLFDLSKLNFTNETFVNQIIAFTREKTLEKEYVEYFKRLYTRTKNNSFRKKYYTILLNHFINLNKSYELCELISNQVLLVPEELNLEELREKMQGDFVSMIKRLLQDLPDSKWQHQSLKLRLMFLIHAEPEQIFGYFTEKINLKLIELFACRLYDVDDKAFMLTLFAYAESVLDNYLGDSAVQWTNDLIHLVKKEIGYREADRLGNFIRERFEHRKKFVKNLV